MSVANEALQFIAGCFSPEDARKIVDMMKTPVLFTRTEGAACPLCGATRCRIVTVRNGVRSHKCWRCGNSFTSVEK